MATPRHIIEPDGDLILVLKNPYPEFAVWPFRGVSDKAHNLRDPRGSGIPVSFDVEYLVSSKHLGNASDYFLCGPLTYAEAAWGVRHLVIEDMDQEALFIVLNLIHGRTPGLGADQGIDMLAKVALVVDHFQCREAVDWFAQLWMLGLELPWYEAEVTRDHVLWIFVAMVFRMRDLFLVSTRLAMEISYYKIPTLGLPIPEEIVDEMELRRQIAVIEASDSIIRVGEELRGLGHGCNLACAVGLAMAFEQQIDLNALISERPWEHMTTAFRELDELVDRLRPTCEIISLNEQVVKMARDGKRAATCISAAHNNRSRFYCAKAWDLGGFIMGSGWGNILNMELRDFFPGNEQHDR